MTVKLALLLLLGIGIGCSTQRTAPYWSTQVETHTFSGKDFNTYHEFLIAQNGEVYAEITGYPEWQKWFVEFKMPREDSLRNGCSIEIRTTRQDAEKQAEDCMAREAK